MTTTRTRSASPNGAGPSTKKAKVASVATDFINRVTPEKLAEYRETYKTATPYRHAVVKDFLSDELVRGVRNISRGERSADNSSSKVLSRSHGPTASEARRAVCKDGDGSKRRPTSTR